MIENLDIEDPGCLNEIRTEPPVAEVTDSSDIGACLDELLENTHLSGLRMANDFIRELQNATLGGRHCGLDPEALSLLRNPPTTSFTLEDKPDLHLAFDLFLASLKASIDVYNTSRASILRRHPEDYIPSYNQMKNILARITGVRSIVHPMCRNSCVAFTGPLADLDHCPRCQEPKQCPTSKRYHQEFHTMPIGPILQALWRNPESARRFQYRRSKTHEIIEELRRNSGKLSTYEDFFHGSDYLEQVRNGNITDDDIVLMFSIDGAQLYAHKASDCWIYLWVIMDFSPKERYKKEFVIPGGFIPGPKKPKNLDSFLFPGLYHLSAIQKEGLSIWNAATNILFKSQLFLGLDTADGPAMAYLSGLVGHHGKYGCRLYCPTPGRHKTNGPHYYPALLKPLQYTIPGCDHPDLSHFTAAISRDNNHYFTNLRYLLESPNDTQYRRRRLETGIVKPTIFLGLPSCSTLPIPRCFGSDIMHLGTFNLSDLLLSLWRGVIDHDRLDPPTNWPWAVLQGKVWESHGRDVAAATPYLPGSFDRPPRNIAEKINSGYKAWEWLLYLYGLAPALLFGILPDPYYSHFCKLVRGMRIIQQYHITAADLVLANDLLQSFVHEFEVLYYQRREDRLHFCRQSIHALLHLASEVTRIGPPICSSQWTMERTIGNLGEEIRQPSNPFANLSQRGILRCQINALIAMLPVLKPYQCDLPRGAVDLGEGYVLLRAKDRYSRHMKDREIAALKVYVRVRNQSAFLSLQEDWSPRITRWARLRLPSGQIARSQWKESLKPINKIRVSRNCRVNGHPETLAVVSVYSSPLPGLLNQSHGTFISCKYSGDNNLMVINVKCIKAVVAMIPHSPAGVDDGGGYFYLVERPGLDVTDLGDFRSETL
ncbi:hypothetical protein HYPSUDRAFT_1074591 [Hypholoma sublateritium FD-334 SS-4]|uniref:Transposase family Tnp2 protein n=1 Tax=Hypholoma sublateritium (strain FD-334 SS-4) TaxID=945553 RepID=A0A0D2KH68_HYPSF|nr:hypothetical protein HYPSUDRAFT_1074591 [Hypholoma sublateritium FD-334 SS-4]